MAGLIFAGLGVAVIGFASRHFFRNKMGMSSKLNKVMKTVSKFDNETLVNIKYYNGGFEKKMTKREAALVLGISPGASKSKVKDAHKRVMCLNHPDRGGSPYIASKINEAKDILNQKGL